MPTRLLSPNVTTAALEHEPLPDDQVVVGSPSTAVATLAELGGTGVGLWEMSEGTARDTEVDEVFVVVAGRGSVTFADGERIDLEPGVAVRLRAGERTEWVVTQRLRKVWVA